MSGRIKRFEPGDEVVVAAHSPFGIPGHKLVIIRSFPDISPSLTTGSAPSTTRYKLVDAAELEANWVTRTYELWDWMLEPSSSVKQADEPVQQATD